jgi:hypothetical protein
MAPRSRIHELRRNIAPLGLDIVAIRSVGYLLEPTSARQGHIRTCSDPGRSPDMTRPQLRRRRAQLPLRDDPFDANHLVNGLIVTTLVSLAPVLAPTLVAVPVLVALAFACGCIGGRDAGMASVAADGGEDMGGGEDCDQSLSRASAGCTWRCKRLGRRASRRR